ncbi:MAG: hypothetical protein EBR94_06245 [Bacteroidetes bacterium]|nr:hypothetical protein [Bacteroidota bacterium]
MKKINSALGIYPTRTSRVSSIDTANQSLESVVFQQGKSILDFDLNVMQDIIAKNQQRFVQSIYKSSGFLTDPSFSLNSNTLTINKSFVNIQGNIFTIASSSNTAINSKISVTIDSGNVNTFVWLEAWYQEVVPGTASGEKISNNPSIAETKDAIIYKFGGADNSDNVFDNVITDPVFGAETTRRIQLRWRIRTSAVNSSDITYGFITGNSSYTTSTSANSSVKAQGGRSSSFIGTNAAANPYTFYRADNYTSTALSNPSTLISILSDSVYRADIQKSFFEFADNPDSSLYVAGRGTDDDAQQLNTVDGRVYGLPLGIVKKSGSTYTFVSLANTIATSTQGTTVVGPTNNSNITLTAQYSSSDASTNNPGQINLASGISITGSPTAAQDIIVTSYDYGTTPSYIVAKRLSVTEKGSAINPSITFENAGSERNTGFYRTSGVSNNTLGVTVAGSAIGNFFYTSSQAYGLSIGASGYGSLSVAGASTLTGNVTSAGAFISTTTSAANNLPTLTSNTLFSSSNVSITGGTISSGVTLNLKNGAGVNPTATGEVQWDSTSRTLKIGYSGSTTYSYGYLGSTVPTTFSGSASTVAASSGNSYEVAKIDHVHGQPSSYNPSSHVATHAVSGSDPFTSSHSLDAVARVGVSITSSSGTASGLVGLANAVQKRRLNFVAGANITLSLASGQVSGANYTFDDSWTDDFLNLTVSANVAGFQDTWSTTSAYTLVNAASMTSGVTYSIATRGTTDFTLYGASSNMIGTVFTATQAGTGTGTVYTGKATFTPIPSSPGDTGSWGMFPIKYMVATNVYIIGWLGTTSQLQWNTIAGTTGQTYTEGSIITASSAVTTLDFTNYGTGVVYPSSTQQFAAHREHTHPRLDGYYTSYSTLPNDGQGSAGTSVNISRGDHTHSLPTYIARQGNVAFGFGDSPQTISNALDVSGTSTYSSLASSLYVRSSASWAVDSGARIALGGAVNGTPTWTAFGGISARKLSSTINDHAGYLSLWVNAGSSSVLTEFFRGYDNGSIYIGRTSQSKPTDADSVVVQGKITAAGFVVSGGSGVSVSSGGTGTTSYAVGDVLYADTTTSLAKLSKPSSATSLLTMTTAGAPAWVSLANTGITGVGTITSGAWNGTVGAITANTGAFTTISASSLITANGGISSTTISTSGLITANGGISATTLSTTSNISGTVSPRCFIAAQGFIPATTSGASFSLLGGMYRLDFSASATTAYCYLIVPPNHNGGKVKARIYGSAATFTVTPEFNTDLGTATFGSGSVNISGATTGGSLVDLASSITAGVPLQLKITCSSTASLYGLYLEFCG